MPIHPLVLAQVALTQDADRLLPPAREALQAGDAETGLWIARRAAALAPDRPWPCTLLGMLAPDAEASAAELRAHRLDPLSGDALRRVGQRRLTAGDLDGAARVQRRLLALDPADAGNLGMVAVTRRWAGAAGAAALLARAVALDPNRAGPSYTLGGLLASEGDCAAAEAVFAALARVAEPPPGMALPTAWPHELVAAVKAGASLGSVMIPDPDLPTNAPEYVENYTFDHVVVSGNGLWALPEPFEIDPSGPAGPGITAFAYCGDTRIFARYQSAGLTPGSPVRIFSYPGDAYKSFRFVVRHDHEPVYDSARPAETAALDGAIRAGRALRLVLEDDEGMVHVLPVHLCFLYLESGGIRLTTQVRWAPEFCFRPAEALWPYYAHLVNHANERQAAARAASGGATGPNSRRIDALEAKTRLVLRRLSLTPDGRCESFGPDGAPAPVRWRWFRIHAALPSSLSNC